MHMSIRLHPPLWWIQLQWYSYNVTVNPSNLTTFGPEKHAGVATFKKCILNDIPWSGGHVVHCTNPCIADVNECVLRTDLCQQNCLNTRGSYVCRCNSGYILGIDGQNCDGMLYVYAHTCIKCMVMYFFRYWRVLKFYWQLPAGLCQHCRILHMSVQYWVQAQQWWKDLHRYDNVLLLLYSFAVICMLLNFRGARV